jgi:citronellol/citronellal dehydrogenase
MTLAGKTLVITVASRGIGLAIALRAARDGARIVIAAKSNVPHPKLPGTIHTAAEAVRQAGGEALAVATDVRDESSVAHAMALAAETFGGIDILVNNASAIFLATTEATPMKRFDLMQQVNVRGTFLCTRQALPWLRRSSHAHVLNIAPPLHSTLQPRWFAPHVAYTMAKYGMSLCTFGMADEFRGDGIAVNALWPETTIDTDAISFIMDADSRRRSRLPAIMGDAAHWVLTQLPRSGTGQFLIDAQVLRRAGVTDFSVYRHAGVDEADLLPDFFL